jgi:hypothetical protein
LKIEVEVGIDDGFCCPIIIPTPLGRKLLSVQPFCPIVYLQMFLKFCALLHIQVVEVVTEEKQEVARVDDTKGKDVKGDKEGFVNDK